LISSLLKLVLSVARRVLMALFSACAGKNPPIAIVAARAAAAIKHAEQRRSCCIESAHPDASRVTSNMPIAAYEFDAGCLRLS
jgi:hypothetical protein